MGATLTLLSSGTRCVRSYTGDSALHGEPTSPETTMRPKGWEMVEKTDAFRQRRAADTARWRERLHRGAAVYPVEVDGTTFDLMERFGGLKDSKTGDRQAVATALGKLLRRALEALLREEAASRH